MIAALLLALSAPATPCAAPPGIVRQADARAEIERDIGEMTRIFNCHDFDGFMGIYSASADTTYVSGGKIFRGMVEIRREYEQFFAGPAQTLSLTPVQIKLLGKGRALVIARARLTAPSTGETTFEAVSSLLLIRERDGLWRILHDHTD